MSKSTWIKIKNQKLDFSRFKKKKYDYLKHLVYIIYNS